VPILPAKLYKDKKGWTNWPFLFGISAYNRFSYMLLSLAS
jgi:hypothetical protein